MNENIIKKSAVSQPELLDSNSPLLSRPATELLSAFGSGKASPGSGSAAALMGLLSAKLILTVCSISKNKPECKKDSDAFEIIISKIREDIEPRLRQLFESDAEDFDRVVALRRLRDQASSSKERADFARASNELLERATDCAFEITDLCMRLIDHGIIIFDNGWHAVRGDSGAAISAAVSGVMSGIFIISLNLKTLKGRKYSRDKIDRCNDLYLSMQSKQAAAFKCVTSIKAEAISAVQLELDVEM